MGYACYGNQHDRDCGYGVPALCDHPDCSTEIHRGVAYACGPSDDACGLFFCSKHRNHWKNDGDEGPFCERCAADLPAFDPKPDITEWITHKLTDPTWADWRAKNPKFCEENEARK